MSAMKYSKAGRTVMMFVTVSDNPTREEAMEISALWETSLFNNHIQSSRYTLKNRPKI
jgi:hypothetical protein